MAWTAAWDFATDKSLTDLYGNVLTCTRASTRKYFDTAGVMQEAAANEAAFDHNPSTLESLGLFVEEARTNILTRSAELDHSDWFLTGASVVTDSAEAPDGTTAYLLTLAVTDIIWQQDTPGTGDFVLSWYVKQPLSGAATHVRVTTNNGGAWNSGLSTKVALTTDWQRVSVSGDLSDTSIIKSMLGTIDETGTHDSDCEGNVLIWGAQLEAGSFPTSYIPTVASSVTRNADAVITTDVSWYSSTEGTMYVSGSQPDVSAINTAQPVTPSDGTPSNRFYFNKASSANINWQPVTGGASQANLTVNPVWADDVNSLLVYAYKTNDFELYANGTRAGTGDQSGSVPTGISELNVGSRFDTNGSFWNGHIAGVAYNTLRLPNGDLSDLSDGTLSPFSLAGASGMSAEEWYRRRRRLRGHRNWLGGAFTSRG